MCGRYTLGDSHNLFRRFHLVEEELEIAGRFNVAPSQHMPVIVREETNGREAANQISLMQWGLVPSWSKDPKPSGGLINARIEGILAKPSFRSPARKRRCLVPCDGFYEWKKEKGGKVPYYIRRRDQELFAFAGIYDVWHGSGGEIIEGYAILTTRPNTLMAPIHDRMPVILEQEMEALWLDIPGADIASLLSTLEIPFPAEALETFPVSTQVNSPKFDFPGLVRRD
ncbi:MAG: SOS response-associated peptidase [Acidobacteria bacterium]|nr:SOS response-associated peptidase [Acidobacteriota bacterium]